jgi:hypothetical protein
VVLFPFLLLNHVVDFKKNCYELCLMKESPITGIFYELLSHSEKSRKAVGNTDIVLLVYLKVILIYISC